MSGRLLNGPARRDIADHLIKAALGEGDIDCLRHIYAAGRIALGPGDLLKEVQTICEARKEVLRVQELSLKVAANAGAFSSIKGGKDVARRS